MRDNLPISAAAWSSAETPYRQNEGGSRLPRASVALIAAGDLTGEGALEFLTGYQPGGTAGFVGRQHQAVIMPGRSGGALYAADVDDGTGTRWTWSERYQS